MGETLCEAAGVSAGDHVLDVACGNGNAALAAARRFAVVTGVDYVPALLERARGRGAADGLALELREADAEALPFDDGAFIEVFRTWYAPSTAPSRPCRRTARRRWSAT